MDRRPVAFRTREHPGERRGQRVDFGGERPSHYCPAWNFDRDRNAPLNGRHDPTQSPERDSSIFGVRVLNTVEAQQRQPEDLANIVVGPIPRVRTVSMNDFVDYLVVALQ